MTDFEIMRSNMVKSQLLPNDISNARLLRAFMEIPRETFVAESAQGLAYSDTILPITQNRYLLKPLVLGKLLQAADLEPSYKVLDIATATGYGAALLSYCVRSIIAVEEDAALFSKLNSNVDALNTFSIVPVHHPLQLGAEEESPFDVILIEGAVAQIPPNLFDQLKPTGKLLALETKEAEGLVQGVIYQKTPHGIAKRSLFECEAYPLQAFSLIQQGFQF
jgi:protein-L-isoaspartate(D-aspartate) O-methyltransferase